MCRNFSQVLNSSKKTEQDSLRLYDDSSLIEYNLTKVAVNLLFVGDGSASSAMVACGTAMWEVCNALRGQGRIQFVENVVSGTFSLLSRPDL